MRPVHPLTKAPGRPQRGASPSVHDKAAALLHSTVRNHALVDGNKRLGLAAVIAFHGMNGHRLTLTNNEAYDFIMAGASGDLDDVQLMAERLASSTRQHD